MKKIIPLLSLRFCFLVLTAFVSACGGGGSYVDGTTQVESDSVQLVESFLATDKPLAPYQTGRAYSVQGVTYIPREDFSYTATGVASHYKRGIDGALTASGEFYFSNQLTAAHKTLPFQTLVRVTNLNNGRSVIVRINDRGPFFQERIIDLSERAAGNIDMLQAGLATVKLEVLETETQIFRAALNNKRVIPSIPTSNTNPNDDQAIQGPIDTRAGEIIPTQENISSSYYVLVGTYTNQIDANAIRDRMSTLGVVFIERSENLYRVFIGPMASLLDAQAMRGRVFSQGAVNATVIRR